MTPLLLTLLLAAVASAGRCPDPSWKLSGYYCYWVSDFNVPWTNIADICSLAQPSSAPASVHDLTANGDLASLLEGKPAWLGLSRPSSSGNWSWQDGSPLDYQYWDGGEPGDGDCGFINHNHGTGQWGSEDCGDVKPAVCQIQAITGCPYGWSEFQGKCCLYSGIDTRLPWAFVAAACKALGPWAMPASIHNDEQNAFLTSLQTSVATYIGLSRPNSSAEWAWSDGSQLEYLNWYTGEPHSSDTCAWIFKDLYDDQWVGYSSPTAALTFYCQADI